MEKLKSRKLWAMIASAATYALNDALSLGMSDETLNRLSVAVVGYLIAQGVVDAVAARNNTVYVTEH